MQMKRAVRVLGYALLVALVVAASAALAQASAEEPRDTWSLLLLTFVKWLFPSWVNFWFGMVGICAVQLFVFVIGLWRVAEADILLVACSQPLDETKARRVIWLVIGGWLVRVGGWLEWVIDKIRAHFGRPAPAASGGAAGRPPTARDIARVDGTLATCESCMSAEPLLGFWGTVVGIIFATVRLAGLTETQLSGTGANKAVFDAIGGGLATALFTTFLGLALRLLLQMAGALYRLDARREAADADTAAARGAELIGILETVRDSAGTLPAMAGHAAGANAQTSKLVELLGELRDSVKSLLSRGFQGSEQTGSGSQRPTPPKSYDFWVIGIAEPEESNRKSFMTKLADRAKKKLATHAGDGKVNIKYAPKKPQGPTGAGAVIHFDVLNVTEYVFSAYAFPDGEKKPVEVNGRDEDSLALALEEFIIVKDA